MKRLGARGNERYAARGGMTALQVKRAVRERDNYACTKCGMSDERHILLRGRRTEVHRLTPGSLYTLAGCVLLCQECHGPEPKRERGTPDQDGYGGIMVRLPIAYLEPLTRLAESRGVSVARVVRDALDRHLESEGIDPPPEPKKRGMAP